MLFKENALEKLKNDINNFNSDNNYVNAIFKPTADVFKSFINQDDEFAQAYFQSDRTLIDCCIEIITGVGKAISDIDVYKKAVNFFFPGATINFAMTINVNGREKNIKQKEKSKNLNSKCHYLQLKKKKQIKLFKI